MTAILIITALSALSLGVVIGWFIGKKDSNGFN